MTRTRQAAVATAMAVALAALLGIGLGYRLADAGPPSDTSADAGFARDMADHHAQAVEMADIIRTRTADDEVRALATDIVLTQQAQIGQMQGWLAAWELPPTSSRPVMAWMSHTGPMPGMAARPQVSALADAPLAEAEQSFFTLMIAHHKAGVVMADAALDRADRPEVRRLAAAIVASQTAEIDVLSRLAGLPVPPAPSNGSTSTTAHGGHGG